MSHHFNRILAAALLVWCWALFDVQARGAAQTRPPVVIIVSAVTGGGDISLGKLRAAFESRPTDYRGVRLIPFNLPLGNPARTLMDRVVLGLAPDRVGAFWIDQRIRSGANAPRSVHTPEMVLRVAASMRGVISYVRMDPKALPAGLEALSIDGRRPTDSAYPLAGH
jgi:hypothetical protein